VPKRFAEQGTYKVTRCDQSSLAIGLEVARSMFLAFE
jgi:hypothetical protein